MRNILFSAYFLLCTSCLLTAQESTPLHCEKRKSPEGKISICTLLKRRELGRSLILPSLALFQAKKISATPLDYSDQAQMISDIDFSHEGTMFATGSYDQTVKLWDTDSLQLRASLDLPQSVETVQFSLDGALISAGLDDGVIKLWNPSTQKYLGSLCEHTHRVNTIAFGKDTLISGSSDSNIKIWDIPQKTCVHTFDGNERSVEKIIYTPLSDEQQLISFDYHVIKVWDMRQKKAAAQLEVARATGKIACSSATNTLALPQDDTIQCRDIRYLTKECVAALRHGKGKVSQVAFSPDSSLLACSLEDVLEDTDPIALWDYKNQSMVHIMSLGSLNKNFLALKFSPDGQGLAALPVPGPVTFINW